MVTLHISHRTLAANRHSFLVNDNNTWITTRTPPCLLDYLDLAIPNEGLYWKHFEKVFPHNNAKTGRLATCEVSKGKRFHLDDISVGCAQGSKDSNVFCLYAMRTYRKDWIGMIFFLRFLGKLRKKARPLRSGERVVRFLNLATLIGYKHWKEWVISPGPNRPFPQLLVENVFLFIYRSVLRGIYKKKSDLLMKKFWDEFCITNRTRLYLFEKVPDADHLRFILEVGNRVKFDFWGMKNGGKGLTEYAIIVFIKQKRYDFVTLLLDYGFTLGEMMAPKDVLETHRNILTRLFLNYTRRESIQNVSMVRFLVRCYENCNFQIELPEIIEVYQKLSRTLPTPSLPPNIVREHLHKALALPNPYFLSKVEEMTAIHEVCDVHPSDSSGVNPQTLSHLSRCVLRNQWAANFQLPTAISNDSPLPPLIKRFLRLEF